ncbi:ribonuclease P/MRP protein subunit POP5 [Polymixia lowei]
MVRLKSRYLLCEINVAAPCNRLLLDDRAVNGAVREAVANAHGDYGASRCGIGFTVKYLNAHTGIVFLRFPKSCYRLIWSALPFITVIENRGRKVHCSLNCLHVGGTIRTCQKFLVRYNTQQLHRMLPKCKSEKEKEQVREAILSCSINPTKGRRGGFEDEVDSGEEEEE